MPPTLPNTGPVNSADTALRARASRVIPGGLWGAHERGPTARRIPAILRQRRRVPPARRRWPVVRRSDVRLGAGDPGPPQCHSGGCGARAGRAGGLHERPRAGAGGPGRDAGRHGAARRLVPVRQERHRRDDELRDHRAGGDGAGGRCCWRAARIMARCRGARPRSPASRPRIARICCTSPTTTSPASMRQRRRPAATWPPSSSRHSGMISACRRRCRRRISRGMCGRSAMATGGGR